MGAETEFDYIVVGAGSAGCVLADKLGADVRRSVLVVEAGPMDRNLMIHVPAGVYSAWRNPKLNWNYQTEREDELFEREIFMPRGKVVGGSSSINSMVYMRGHPLDYDRWADECGLTHWRYADCLPYFRAGESSDRGADDWRGDHGPLGVTRGQFDNPLYDAFIESGEQAGQGRSEDLNGYNPSGVSRLDATRRNGRRCSAAVAYLRPALKRGNVTLATGTMVERILFEGNAATGVVLNRRGEQKTVHASREVLLAGGAINSPQLLMLSGVGPPDDLRRHGIEPRIPLNGVGRNLQDHATIILEFESRRRFPIHKVNTPLRKAAAGLLWVFTRGGLASSNIWEAGGLIHGNDSVPYPNLQYHFGPVGFDYTDNKIILNQAFAIHVDQLRPRSRGIVALQSADPFEKPALYFNYFSAAGDLAELIEGVHRVRELVAQRAFAELAGAELSPGSAVDSDAGIGHWIRLNSSTDFHPCGTCRMGAGEDAVVDAQLRVHGCDKLRVIDASVMPRVLSANLNAPTQMIAARAADYILGKAQLKPEKVAFAFQ